MQDKLKQFVDEHRSAFDTVEAPSVFVGMQSVLPAKSALKFFTKYAKMIKFGFGASSLVVATTVAVIALRQPSASEVKMPTEKKVSFVHDSSSQSSPELSSEGVLSAKAEVLEETKVVSYFTPPDSVPIASAIPPQAPANPEPVSSNAVASKDSAQVIGLAIDTSFANVKRIVVRIQYCDVQVQGHADKTVNIRGNVSELAGNMLVLGRKWYVNDQNVLHYSLVDGTLQVWIEEVKLEKRKKVDANVPPSILKISVPQNLAIDIENSSGNISLSHLQANDVKLETKFGHVNLVDVTAALQVKTASGHIRASEITGNIKATDNFGNVQISKIKGKTEVVCHSGNVTIANAQGNCDVSTSFGNQKYQDIVGDIKAISASGGIHFFSVTGSINCSSSFGSQTYDQIIGDIVAQASSGVIKLNQTKGSLQLSTSFGNIKGDAITVLAGAQLKASSGAIHIDFTNDFNDLRFDLTSSSGKIKLDDKGAVKVSDESIKSGSGAVLVSGTTTFGNQFYH